MKHAALLACLLFAQDDPVQKLIEKLGDEDFDAREKASAELLKLGEKVLPALGKAAEHPDAEVRSRIRDLRERIVTAAFWSADLLSGRLGGKRNLVARGGGGVDTEDGVLAALKWLSRHQADDGSWKTKDYAELCRRIPKYAKGERCEPSPGHPEYEVGVTGLALLAFLGAGYTHLAKDTYDGICFGDVVKKGLDGLIARQDPKGCLGGRNAIKYMYGHAIASLALSEAFSLTKSEFLSAPAARAAEFTLGAQNPGKAWRYSWKCGDNDSSVTFWAAFSLCPARPDGREIPAAAVEGTRAWLNEVTEESYGRVGYTHRGTGKVFVPGMNEHFDHHEALTAIGVILRLFIDRKKADPLLSMGVDLLLRDKPKWDGTLIDFYYWHLATMALFQYDGPSGPKWKAWNEGLKEALVRNQNTAAAGCKSGSWEPVDRWSGEGGRVYATALNALTLETYYRYRLVVPP